MSAAPPPSSLRQFGRHSVRYLTLAWLCLAAMLAYGQRFPLGVCAAIVQEDLGLSDRAMGWALGAYFFTYAALQIPGGWFAERFGSRRTLALYVAGSSIATTFAGVANGAASLIGMRLAAGAAQAGIFPATTGSMARWFPATERALASGLLAGFMSLGGACATALCGWLLGYMSWRGIFAVFGLPGILWAVGFWWWFRERPEDMARVSSAELARIRAGADPATNTTHAPPVPWAALLRSRAMWLIAWQQFFRAAGYALFASWFPKFLQQVYGVTTRDAGWLTSIPLIAVVIGSWLGGIVSDWLLVRTGSRRGSRQGTAAVTMLCCAVLFVAAYFQTAATPAVTLVAAAAFLGSIAGPVAYAITIDMGGNHVTTVFSIMNMAGNIGAATFPVVVGTLVARTERWEWVSLFVAGIYVAGAVCWLLLDSTGTVFAKTESPQVIDS